MIFPFAIYTLLILTTNKRKLIDNIASIRIARAFVLIGFSLISYWLYNVGNSNIADMYSKLNVSVPLVSVHAQKIVLMSSAIFFVIGIFYLVININLKKLEQIYSGKADNDLVWIYEIKEFWPYIIAWCMIPVVILSLVVSFIYPIF